MSTQVSTPKLLNFTRKFGPNLDFLPRPELYAPPFDRMVSRLDYKTELFNFAKAHESVKELLALPKQSLSWRDCCLRRAEELRLLGKPKYYLSYSGGIDSTVMVAAILETWPAEDREKLCILLTHQSIHENPTFFDKYISKLPLRNYLLGISKELIEEDALLLTGELGDQLFGSDMLMVGALKFGEEILAGDYKEHAPKIIEHLVRKRPLASGDAIFRNLEPIVAECPFPVRTSHDFFWWFNFSQKWQHVKFRFLESKSWSLQARYGSHVQCFYDTPEFQLWSLNNHDKKLGKTWSTYKHVAKDFLYEFSKDPAQLKLQKVQSLVMTYFMNEKRIAILDDYRPIKTLDELRPHVRQEI